MLNWPVLLSLVSLSATVGPLGPTGPFGEGDDDKDKGPLTASNFSALELRGIGPALTSGRISDLVVDPTDPARWFVAVASGGVWRTENHGTTFEPVFEGESSFSIGCLALDPRNPNVVWVGSGENNSQRSVSWGDGVYRSRDGGKSWTNLGLKESEHIGRIAIDPRDSDVVYVAAQGPLWRSGGERGLYKTKDGGATWQKVLDIGEHTGINEVHLDPREPDTLYASSYQRRRHAWTLIDGGPESTIHKSTDGGATWRKIEQGLPKVDKGRIGLAVSPVDPDVLFAIVEAADGKGGTFRSDDRGESWEKRSDKVSSSPQYYQELLCDPRDVDTLYCLDTFTTVSRDGGKTWKRLGNERRHVDDHALWVDPRKEGHILIGGDGGLYETWDGGAHFDFKENLSVAQFYKVSADQALPFYNVYGGTQDNNSLGGPSRTPRREGITNSDWWVTVGGDGYEAQVDPTNPDIVYTQSQYGGLVRFDKRSGEMVDIKPRETPGEPPLKWNWDSPLALSHHQPTRLYFAANRLFKSDDRGNSWKAISADLTRQLDRDQLEVMGRVWEVDAVAKNSSTSFYGNSVAFSESPLDERTLFVGTDDGLVHATRDGGATWTRIESFPGVPERTYVSRLEASRHDSNTVYAAFDNHKNGDFKPYVLVSRDRGATWTSIAGNLPARDVVYALAQDAVVPELLFAGTEFGVYFTRDHGTTWIELTGKFPTIAVRDLEIQRRECDLIVGTFGRGIYVLDDYSPLRTATAETLAAPAHLFAARTAPLYVEGSRLGNRDGHGSQGSTFFSAPNPPFGALFTYHLAAKLTTRKERRQEAEKEARKRNETAPYPSYEALRAEDLEEAPEVLISIRDAGGALVRRVPASREKGLHRVAWDLRYPERTRVQLRAEDDADPWVSRDRGPLALGGKYTATLEQVVDGVASVLAGPVSFEVAPLNLATLPAADRAAALAFQNEVTELRRAVRAAGEVLDDAVSRVRHARVALRDAPKLDLVLLGRLQALDDRLSAVALELNGDETLSARNRPAPPSIRERVENVAESQFSTTSAPTETERDALRYAGAEFGRVLANLRKLLESDLREFESTLEQAGAPWTPGRLPQWR
ncbi:MAG: glycosyl hydrolase [Planctomycetes bacterium]|nr:glycosyl hydrolase [Planctomycetota bacterium]